MREATLTKALTVAFTKEAEEYAAERGGFPEDTVWVKTGNYFIFSDHYAITYRN